MCVIFFFFKQKTAYEMRISDWSSDVCSSDLHAWSEKAKKMMLDKQMKKATKAKEAKDPQADYEACFYRTPTGDYGFPTIGLKAAMVGACRFVDMKMTEARGAFHIDGEMLTVQGEPRPREDMVRVGLGTADIRYRPEFPEWSILAAIKR